MAGLGSPDNFTALAKSAPLRPAGFARLAPCALVLIAYCGGVVAWRSVGGFTLVEVLVALFVLAVGVLGASATQLAAQRTRHQAALLSEAVQLAAAVSSRMRANAVQMALGDGANPYLTLRYDAAAEGAPAAPAVLCYGETNCDPAQLAAFDLYEAKRAVHDRFPRGRIVVCRDGGGWDGAAGALTWECAGGAGVAIMVKVGWHGGGDRKAGPAPSVALVVPG